MSSWDRALDDFERLLRGYRSVLDDDADPPALPTDTSPLTEEPSPAERARALHLLDQAASLEAELETRKAESPQGRVPIRRRRTHAPASVVRNL